MGLLADVFSYGDTLKRRLGGLLSDPAGTVDLGVRRFAEDQNKLLSLMDQSGYTPGAQSVLQTPQDKQVARNELAKKALETYGGLLGATVWHGSPHKFNKFDSSKIGTGEGAQAYGHGLYLAESDTVARHYKNAGADPSTFVPVRSIRDPAQMAATALDRAGGDMRHATAVLTQNMQSGDITAGAALQLLKQRAALPESKYAGHMYKVDLPDDAIAKMLDWDKPLSQQSPEVRAAFESRVAPLREQYAKPAPGWGDLGGAQSYDPTGRELLELLRKRDATTAQDFLGNGLGRDVSEQLRSQGIPGIRYLDGGSRGAGTGTSNYVVFPGNENLLKILERNGQPLP